MGAGSSFFSTRELLLDFNVHSEILQPYWNISLLFGKANTRIFGSEDDRMENGVLQKSIRWNQTCVCYREVPSIGPLKRNKILRLKLPTLIPNISLKSVEAQHS